MSDSGPGAAGDDDAAVRPDTAGDDGAPARPGSAAPAESTTPQAIPGYLVRWGIPSSVLGLGAFIAALVLGIALYYFGVIPDPNAAQFVTNILGYGVMFGVVVLVVRGRGSGSLAIDVGLRFRLVDVLLGLGGAFVAKIFAIVFALIAQGLAGSTPVQGNLTIDSDTFWIILNTIVFAALLGPFVEEVFFRGLLLRGIRNRVLRREPGSVDAAGIPQSVDRLRLANTTAIVVSSIVFMALHLYEASSWESALALGGATLFLGLVNARLAVSTGRLGAGIVSHVLFNGSSILLLLAGG